MKNFYTGEDLMKTKEDARVIKTKAKLLETFKDLLKEKSFEDITVNEICRLSDVRRATFYKHFDDKYAFLSYFVGSLRDGFDKTVQSTTVPDRSFAYYAEYIKRTVTFLTENEKMVKNALNSEVLPTLIEVIKEKNYEDTCVRLRHSVEAGMRLPASVEIMASMITGAVSSTILMWFKGGKKMPADELVQEMCSIFEPMKVD